MNCLLGASPTLVDIAFATEIEQVIIVMYFTNIILYFVFLFCFFYSEHYTIFQCVLCYCVMLIFNN